MHQGKTAEAAQEFAKSKAGFASLGNPDSFDSRTRTYLCAAQMQYGGALAAQRKFVEAQKELEPAIAVLEKLAGVAPPSQELQYTLAEAYNQEGILFVSRARIATGNDERTSDWKAAKSWFEKSSATWDKVKNPARLSTYGLEVSLPSEVSRRTAECDVNLRLQQNPSN